MIDFLRGNNSGTAPSATGFRQKKGSCMKLYTIDFTKKSAEKFLKSIKNANIRLLVDVRLNNNSQLSGFAKRVRSGVFLVSTGIVQICTWTAICPGERSPFRLTERDCPLGCLRGRFARVVREAGYDRDFYLTWFVINGKE